MSSENPFVSPEKAATPATGQSYTAWGIAVAAILAALLFLLLWLQGGAGQQRELQSLRARLTEASANLDRALAECQTNRDWVATLRGQVADLEKDKELAAQMAKNLESELRSDLESKDVTISKLQGKLTVNILDRVMFDSGEAVLKPDGAVVMRKIAALLAAHPELKIHVIGHTDNIPIRPGALSRFASNWELSAARALAAVHFLTEKAGMDPRRAGAVAYGEFRPIADNATPEGRARNRRIAITLLPDELAAADAVPATTPQPLPEAAIPPAMPTTP